MRRERRFFLFKAAAAVYNCCMDERKRQIGEAEQRKKEQTALLGELTARIGEAILSRAADSGMVEAPAFAELAAYRRLTAEIAGSRDSISGAEEQMRRFRELEDGIAAAEREEGLCSKALAGAHAGLGKLLLEEAGGGGPCADFCAPHMAQAGELLAKAESLEERLSGLERSEKGNVFTWIGKSAQSLVLRSFLGKAQDSLEHLRRSVGERFRRKGGEAPLSDSEGIAALCGEAEERELELEAIRQGLSDLRDERRGISDGFSADGGPAKRVQALKAQIAQAQSALAALRGAVGATAAFPDAPPPGGLSPEEAAERRQAIQSLAAPEDAEDLGGAGRASLELAECDALIERMSASLAIDDENAKIEKHRRMIREKQGRIAQAQKGIIELEGRIRDSESAIEKLRLLL